jgi:5-methylcytosine-specific restriction endonuclease McrA
MQKLEPTLDKRCGTYAGYRAHRKRNEQLCTPCREAMRTYRREKYNPDKNRKYVTKYKEANKELIKQRQKKYTKLLDPEIKAANKAARAEIANSPERIEAKKARQREASKAYRLANKEKIKAKQREYGIQNRAQLRENSRRYRARNHEQYAAKRHTYYLKNKERIDETRKKWLSSKPYYRAEVDRRRRARKAENGYESYTTEQVLELYGDVCYICNESIDLTAERQPGRAGWEEGLHIDHFIPISKNGPDTLANVRPTHGRCNLQKQSNLPKKATV